MYRISFIFVFLLIFLCEKHDKKPALFQPSYPGSYESLMDLGFKREKGVDMEMLSYSNNDTVISYDYGYDTENIPSLIWTFKLKKDQWKRKLTDLFNSNKVYLYIPNDVSSVEIGNQFCIIDYNQNFYFCLLEAESENYLNVNIIYHPQTFD
ncbi:hypothetical protein OO013_08030 [Mangrovivirga sp. M17]|uniref:Uncharacterized protein n=1 Tax=Mangrovivirga halotolerans TaxID=2993936 RepID=A0ABT3RPV1_9BACT|nr:hypothetical protein [Mangrovivirga halotolerans]MCX2743809.1 hypothetical protein [Mangrovivirga halotolerans]